MGSMKLKINEVQKVFNLGKWILLICLFQLNAAFKELIRGCIGNISLCALKLTSAQLVLKVEMS